jgi:hypothetical protein
MKFIKGQRVVFLEDNEEGIIAGEKKSGLYLVEDEFGLTHEVLGNKLLDKITGEIGNAPELTKKQKQAKAAQSGSDVSPQIPIKVKNGKLILDLHMEELTDKTGLPKGVTYLDFQLSCVKEALRYCEKQKISKAVFIHGKGLGILRAELLRLLNGYKNIEHWDALDKEYSFGAVEARIRGLYQ